MVRPLSLLALLLALPAIGCTTTRSYDVTVRNDYTEPMTIWLTKDGPPMETTWLPPEDIAMMRKWPAGVRLKGVVLQPGKTGDLKATGKFDSGVNAVLRVYRGHRELDELFAISRGSPNRTDILLPEGRSSWVINRRGETVPE